MFYLHYITLFLDLKQDIAIECQPYYENSYAVKNYWKGLKFEKAQFKKSLIHQNTLYQPVSLSEMNHVILTYVNIFSDAIYLNLIHLVYIFSKFITFCMTNF